MHILNSSLAYLFWLANNNKGKYLEFCVSYSEKKLDVWGVLGTGVTHLICHHQMRIFNSSFAYLLWLAINNEGKYPEFMWAIAHSPHGFHQTKA